MRGRAATISMPLQCPFEVDRHNAELVDEAVEGTMTLCPDRQFKEKHDGIQGDNEIGNVGCAETGRIVTDGNHERLEELVISQLRTCCAPRIPTPVPWRALLNYQITRPRITKSR